MAQNTKVQAFTVINLISIFIFQVVPDKIRYLKLCYLRTQQRGVLAIDEPILGITEFPSITPEKDWGRNALIVLSPSAWVHAKRQFPNIRLFNYVGLIHTLVSILNRFGFEVDIVDSREPSLPRDDYDLILAHGGAIGGMIHEIPKSTFILQYVAGLYWRTFECESNERYDRFCKAHKVGKKLSHKRSNKGQEVNMDRLIGRSDLCFTADLPRMINGFGEHQRKFVRTGLGSYLSSDLAVDVDEKDFYAGRNRFIYVGGTGGNIQKGLDVILEAFALCPEAHLYIYCKVETEILKYARELLALKNVHYVYHWRLPCFRKKLRKLLGECNFTIHAPVNTGAGTAFMGSLGIGLIPVGYIDFPEGFEPAILADDWHPEAIAGCIREALSKSTEWCAEASRFSELNYRRYASPESFEENFSGLIDEIVKSLDQSS